MYVQRVEVKLKLSGESNVVDGVGGDALVNGGAF
jgi:hypothetical protein